MFVLFQEKIAKHNQIILQNTEHIIATIRRTYIPNKLQNLNNMQQIYYVFIRLKYSTKNVSISF